METQFYRLAAYNLYGAKDGMRSSAASRYKYEFVLDKLYINLTTK